MSVKIIQIVYVKEDERQHSHVLGLGDDGVVYHCPADKAKWDVYIPLEFIDGEDRTTGN